MKKILGSVWVLALLLAIPVIVFLPPIFDKYLVEIENSRIYPNSDISSIFFEDIDNDGHLERFETFNQGQSGVYSFQFFDVNGGMIDQINWPFPYNSETALMWFADFDNDNNKEVYTFSFQKDSLYLNWIQLTPEKGNFNSIPVCEIFTYKDSLFDYQLNEIHCLDIDNDGKNELIFPVIGGFSIQPRAIYKVDLETREVVSSESTGCANAVLTFYDLDGDGKKEIIADGQVAPIRENFNIPYNIPAPYLKIFDSNLDYYFPPIRFCEGIQTTTHTNVFQNVETTEIVCTVLSAGDGCEPFKTYKISLTGEKIDSFQLPSVDVQRSRYLLKRNNGRLLTQVNPGEFIEFDENLKVKKIHQTGSFKDFIYQNHFDANDDGTMEYFFNERGYNNFIIFSDNFKTKINLEVGFDNPGMYIKPKSKGKFLVYNKTGFYLFSFKKNNFYLAKYPIYILIYMASVLFIWFIQGIRTKQLRERYELQNQVRELQLIALRNQLDPHFIYNTFNSIASVIKQGRGDEAYDIFVLFSKMVRKNLENSKEIYTTLEHELHFVKDYLHIQKFRFKEMFDYKIEMNRNLNLKFQIPKMLLQIHVENALKHGIRPKRSGGTLIIRLKEEKNQYKIEVEDNGIGRQKAGENAEHGNGIGLKTINQILELSSHKSKQKIEHQIIDLKDENGSPAGTKVVITILN